MWGARACQYSHGNIIFLEICENIAYKIRDSFPDIQNYPLVYLFIAGVWGTRARQNSHGRIIFLKSFEKISIQGSPVFTWY